MPKPLTRTLQDVAAARDRLTADSPPSTTQLAAHVELLHALVVQMLDTHPNRAGLLGLLRILGRDASTDSPAGHAVRAAAARMAEELGG